MIKAYLAGPDVFFPEAKEHAARKVQICAKFGIIGLPPLNEDINLLSAMTEHDAWNSIYNKDISMMEDCDIVIANLTPFGGVSADAGTLVEIGWFLGRGKPIFGYSNSSVPFEKRIELYNKSAPGPNAELGVESFGLPDNLMIAGAVWHSGYPIIVCSDRSRDIESLEIFEMSVRCAAEYISKNTNKNMPHERRFAGFRFR